MAGSLIGMRHVDGSQNGLATDEALTLAAKMTSFVDVLIYNA